jgi:hypothetical protein
VSGPAYFVVGTSKATGQDEVIEEARTRWGANRLRDRLAATLEGYRSVHVERAGAERRARS